MQSRAYPHILLTREFIEHVVVTRAASAMFGVVSRPLTSHPTMGQRAENSFDARRDILTKRVICLGLLKPQNPSRFSLLPSKALYGTSPTGTLSEVKLRGDAAALCLPCFKLWDFGFRA